MRIDSSPPMVVTMPATSSFSSAQCRSSARARGLSCNHASSRSALGGSTKVTPNVSAN